MSKPGTKKKSRRDKKYKPLPKLTFEGMLSRIEEGKCIDCGKDLIEGGCPDKGIKKVLSPVKLRQLGLKFYRK